MHLKECEGETHTWSLALLHGVRWGGAWRGEAMGADARRALEWSTEIWPRASQVRGFLLLFIFSTSLCLILFDRDRSSR
jgi:hypothetical protein